MNNVIQFPPMIKRQVVDAIENAEEYAELWLANDKYATANIAETDDGRYVVTVYPADDLMRKAVENARKEFEHVL